jgi:diguanylate cyclase (GGDEF)-like protein
MAQSASGHIDALKVVVAEDDPVSRTMLVRILSKWGFRAIEAQNGEEAWIKLGETKAQFLVTDWAMPVMDGVELCTKIRESSFPYYVYIVLLTSKNEKDEVVRGLRAGADDYLTKPFDREELKARLRSGQRIVTLESQLLEAQRKLELKATIDDLTGVFNRRAILARLREELSRAEREHYDLSIAMVDIDRFKRINDGYGHAAGDFVLQEVVNRLLSGAREYDTIGRLGGEEFVIVLPNASLARAHSMAERLRVRVSTSPVVFEGGRTIDVTVSIGVSCAVSAQIESLENLLAAADAALYRAKKAGRNRVEVATDSFDEAA